MKRTHHMFAGDDPLFYDHPVDRAEKRRFAAADRPTPAAWRRHEDATWQYLTPAWAELPDQGWKIHVSAVPAEAAEVVELVSDYCLGVGLPHKFLVSPRVHHLNNSKYARRGSSGKLLTVYPADEAQLESVLAGLGPLLAGRAAPYVLGDLRWQDGPLYLRYGGFRERWCTLDGGERVLAIARPDGTLVPDRRNPYFELPEWLEVPACVAGQLRADEAATAGLAGLPYEIERALHFSNGGGIYLARDRESGAQVVLREARPLAGLDGAGTDAVARLHTEARALRALAGLEFVPRLIDEFTVWEHHYLAEEYVEGETLRQFLARSNPLTRPDPTPAELARYTEQALDVLDQLQRAVDQVHARGYVFGDLHPANVLLRPDGRICLVDFEVAHRPDREPGPSVACPGFVAPHADTGFERDRYALDCIRLALFLPYTMLLDLQPGKVDQLADAMAEFFPVPAAHTERVRRGLRRPGEQLTTPTELFEGSETKRLPDSLARAILASATPERPDRLFPGDPAGLSDGGWTLAHGAAGVLHALHSTGQGVEEAHLDWLWRAARRADDPRPGLYGGLHGAALVLAELGREEQALELVRRAAGTTELSLHNGLAGIGLALRLLHRRTGDTRLRAALDRTAEQLAAALDPAAPPPPGAGLLHGPSGIAEFFLQRHRDDGDPAHLDLAARALRADLAQCRTSEEGAVNLQDGTRLLPYLGSGSGGVGLALGHYLRHRPDPEFAAALDGILLAARARLVIFSGLFHGRAGLLALLAEHRDRPGSEELIDRQLRLLAWHAVPFREGTAFAGDQLHRLSMDVATGTAGVLLAVHAANGAPLDLPGLPGHP
ncbi:class III lanthionine synthetase LanKC [Streptomyces sp. TLI_171]|uniref:class III lanthionine synthetase LanKC n=1 Tax=Streptomyces sp. TLI_171 TaxID=1938859 RepID=UPI00117EFB03|nr:class III lanthionine synthetase LanKC [Streptomyces sp. TLI_171]